MSSPTGTSGSTGCPNKDANKLRAPVARSSRCKCLDVRHSRPRGRDGRRHRRAGGLQQAPRQHDDIVGFPRAKPRQGRCRWSAAARNRYRPPFRCTGRMVASATDARVRTLTPRIPRSGSSTDRRNSLWRRTGSNSTQPPRSLPGDFLNFAKSRHFRRLAARSLVSGEEFRASCTEGRESGSEPLLDDFSISEIWAGRRPETGCVPAETGSNPPRNGAFLL
jgi:hypothetical protein